MATNSVNCTIVGHTSGYNSFADYSVSPACYAGYNNYNYYAYVLKFTTPTFAGASESINFNFWMYKGVGTTVRLRYAICSSDANKTLYCETSSAVTDSYQITTGTVSFSNMTTTTESRTLTVSTTGLQSNQTYYLILWAYNQTGIELREINSAWGSYSITMGYNDGVVWIDNGSSFEAYQCYIDNGTSWDLCVPYIDNGSSWDAAT